MTQTFQPVPLLAVQIGATVTFQCFFSKYETEYVVWFKHTVGGKPHHIATTHKYSNPVFYKEFEHGRFKIHSDESSNNLTISEIQESDFATYYCGKVINYEMIFLTGTFLIIKELQSNSRAVVQQLISDTVHPGDSVTLQCTVDSETCAGDHSVYWFRHGSGESLPGLIYTHGNRSDECEKSPEAGSPTHNCVYSLPKRNLSRSDAGIYYCAVVTCGEILFGNGTHVNIEETAVNPVLLGLGAALVLCLILIIALVCYIYKNTSKMSL
ncbi:uncharacterized protein LOC108925255 [Scleropages formosus]|uniref:uncharacterized protein LOC108925255 n=1 Tax=Scleropages formosus TaxID=113540 RepID=UPI0010FABBED|nr:uncharacterized protein LOC108925255 [Scleropages formosus]